LIRRLTVIGVGLIGGSFAAALRERALVHEVVGCGRSRANLDVALSRGLIDRASQDPSASVAGADVVFVATPVAAIAPLLTQIRDHVEAEALITDAGSVKAPVANAPAAAALAPGFVPGHPIAGTENSGAEAADPRLFDGTRWILTPLETSGAPQVERLEALAAAVGARPERMPPFEHDRRFAWASHMPHALAFALAEALSAQEPEALHYGGGGLHDFLRVAASDPVMWRDIFLANQPMLQSVWTEVRRAVDRLLAEDDAEVLAARLAEVRRVVRQVRRPAVDPPV